MDYIYGKLNQQVEKLKYKGKSTNTADVIIDNKNSTISVNVSNIYTQEEINQKVQELNKKIDEVEKNSIENIDNLNKKFMEKVDELDTTLIELSDRITRIDDRIKNMKPIADGETEILNFDTKGYYYDEETT